MASVNNPYVALKAGYEQSLNDAQAADQALLQQRYNQDVASANQNYNNAANEAYIAYRQGQAALPEQLSAAGLNGGASETAMARLQAAYGNNLATNAAARQNALTELGNGYQNNLMALQNSYMKQISDAIAEYDRLIAEWEEANAPAYSSGGYSYYGGRSGGSGGSGSETDYQSLLNGGGNGVSGGAGGGGYAASTGDSMYRARTKATKDPSTNIYSGGASNPTGQRGSYRPSTNTSRGAQRF